MHTELKDITFMLSDVEEKTAIVILKDYLITDRLFEKKMINPDTGKKERIDLYRFLCPFTDDIYKTMSNNTPAHLIDKKSKRYKVCKSVKISEMREDFIKRLEHTDYKRVFILRDVIEIAIDNLIDDHRAVLYWFIFPGCKLAGRDPKLRNFQIKLDKMPKSTRRDRLNKALELLVTEVIRVQESLEVK